MALKKKSGEFSYSETESRGTASISGTYKVGSVVRTADRIRDNNYATAVYGVLSLPQSVFSGFCTQTRPVLFLEDSESKCVQQVQEDSCSTASPLSAPNYLVSRNVVHPPCPSPSQVLSDGILSDIQGEIPSLAETEVKYFCEDDTSSYVSKFESEANLTNSGTSLFPSQQERQTRVTKRCVFDDSLTAPPTPKFDNNTQVCSNVVLSVKYVLEWNGNQIIRVRVNVTLGDIVLRKSTQIAGPRVAVLTQSFQATFVHWSNDSSLMRSTRSGNPGYNLGSPVVGVFNRISNEYDDEPLSVNICMRVLSLS